MPAFRPRNFEPIPDLELEETQYENVKHIRYDMSILQTTDKQEGYAHPADNHNQHGRTTRGLFEQHRRYLWAAVPLTAAVLWTIMMAYFYVYFITLPRVNGMWPRIGLSYASFPFISCVGAVRLSYFQGFCIAVSVFNVSAFALNLYLMREIRIGRVWRYLKASSSGIASTFLILLSFFSVESNNRLHLIFTSMQIIFTGLARTLDGFETHQLLKYAPHNRHINRANTVKQAAAIVAGPSSMLALIGIYGCRDALKVLKPGTTCHKLVVIAAPAEWILAATWAIYLLAIAMELYRMEAIREDLLLQIEKRTMWNGHEGKPLLVSSISQ